MMKPGPTRRDRVDHHPGEAEPVVERAARRRRGDWWRRPETIHQMPIGLELNAIEPRGWQRWAALHSRPRCGRCPIPSASLGKAAMGRLAHRRGERTGSQSALFQPVRRPDGVSWIITLQSNAWQASVSSASHGHDLRRDRHADCRKAAGLSRLTSAEPAVMVSAIPPLAFSSW